MDSLILTLETPKEAEIAENSEISESIIIEQDKDNYILNSIIKNDTITLTIEPGDEIGYKKYYKHLKLQEIQKLDKSFNFNSLHEFLENIKTFVSNNQLKIIKKGFEIIINIKTKGIFGKNNVKIPLILEKISQDETFKKIFKELLIIKENMKKIEINYEKQKEEIVKLKEENEILKEENEVIKNKLNITDLDLKKEIIEKENIDNMICKNSSIIKEKEFDFIKSNIENKMKKKIKNIKKLYRATVDGGDPSKFHEKCDNIPYTLVLIKSMLEKRFGGFTSTTWESNENPKFKDDKNAFLFSLDIKQIFPYKNTGYAINTGKDQGPIFGKGFDIGIKGNPINDQKLYTYEGVSYDFGNQQNVLSGEDKGFYIFASEYEVFQIIF